MDIGKFLSVFENVKQEGNGQYKAKCPSHDDKKASLSITEAEGKILLNCFAGCKSKEIVTAVGLEMKDLFQDDNFKNNKQSKIEKVYKYTDGDGNVIHEKIRWRGKGFSNRVITKESITFWGTTKGTYYETYPGSNQYSFTGDDKKKKLAKSKDFEGVTPALYNLPNLLKAIENKQTVYWVEGEKDADRLNSLGLTATTNFEGAGINKIKKIYTKYFKDADVIICQDNDKAGRETVKDITELLKDTAKSIKNIDLSNVSSKKGYDISDYFDEGYTKEDFLKLVTDVKNVNDDSNNELEGKFFLVPRNINNPESGLKVDVSLLAMYMKRNYDIRIYKNQFRFRETNYYRYVEDIKKIISSEIPEKYRVPKNIRDCEELLEMDAELILLDEQLAPQQFISFKNGVLNVEKMLFREHDDLTVKYLTFINQVGYDYDPNVSECEYADNFFKSATNGNEDDVKYLYQVLGVLMSGYRDFKNIFYFTGKRNTGKSVYMHLAELLLTNPDGTRDFSNLGLRTLTDETSKEFSSILGKRANICGETPDLRISNDTLLKQLSGGDTISAQVKFTDPVEFINKAMLVFAGNTGISFFVSDKNAISERMLIYEFKNVIPENKQIKRLEQKICISYVIKKAVEQLKIFVDNNQEFKIPEEITANREKMLIDSDTIYKFYKEKTIISNEPKDRISNFDLYDEYLRFLVNEGHLRNNFDGTPDISRFKITQYIFVAEIKKYHGEENYKRNLAYKNYKADVFVNLRVLNNPPNEIRENKNNVVRNMFN